MSKLPPEIVEQIVENCTNNTKIQCITTCQLWYCSYYRYLLQTVFIATRQQLKSFLQLLEKYGDREASSHFIHNSNIAIADGRPIGHYVRELRFKKRIGITQEQFQIIGRHCPNLEIFDFNDWRHYYPSALKPFKRIKQIPKLIYSVKSHHAVADTKSTLTHLYMERRAFVSFPSQNSLLSFLQQPGGSLTHLTIEGNYDFENSVSKFTLNPTQLDALHQLCPHLTYIRFSTFNLAADERDVAYMLYTIRKENYVDDELTVVPQMRSLLLWSLQMDNSIWLPYLALKYPNLTKLHLSFSMDCFDTYLDGHNFVLDPDECFDAFSRMAYLLRPSLKFLNLTDMQASHFDAVDFFNQLSNNGVKLNSLALHYQSDFFLTPVKLAQRWALTNEILWTLINERVDSIRVLDLDIYVGASRKFQEFLEPISMCKHLKELYLASDEYGRNTFNPYPIDEILDACRALTTLRLARMSIVINNKHSSKDTHPLRKFTAAVSCVTEDLFTYLAQRCPRLNRLEVDNVVWAPRQLEMRIDMPNHNFEYVYVKEVNNLHTALLDGSFGRGTRVNFFAITQMVKRRKKLSRYLERANKINDSVIENYPPNVAECMEETEDYYHLYDSIVRRLRWPLADVRKLRKDEVKTFLNILHFYQANMHMVRIRAQNNGERLDRYVSRDSWKEDVQYGYIHLVCNSVKTYRHNSNELHWPEA